MATATAATRDRDDAQQGDLLDGVTVAELVGLVGDLYPAPRPLAETPELLFLDEPTAGMDVQARRAFWRGVRGLADRGVTVLFATHYLEEADEYADRIVVLVGGKVVADGPAAQIKAGVGSRRIRATVPAEHDGLLRDLPGVRGLQRHGESVLVESADADATVRALFASGLPVRDVEVAGADLEDAFLALAANPGEES